MRDLVTVWNGAHGGTNADLLCAGELRHPQRQPPPLPVWSPAARPPLRDDEAARILAVLEDARIAGLARLEARLPGWDRPRLQRALQRLIARGQVVRVGWERLGTTGGKAGVYARAAWLTTAERG